MKDAYYFSHDSNARNDTKILAMRSEFGTEGYGRYWIIVEVLRDETEYKLKLTDSTYKALAMQMQCKNNEAENFIKKCIKDYELFETDDEYFWSESLIRRMEKREKIRESRQNAANKRWENTESNAKAMQVHSKSNASAMQNDAKERKGKERKEKEDKIFYAEFVSLSNTEYNKLVQEYGEINTKRMITKLDNYKGANNKKYASDYRAILSWVVKDVVKEIETKQAPLGLQEYDMSKLGKREEGWQ